MAKKSRKLSRRNLIIASAALLIIIVGLWLVLGNTHNKGSGTIPSTNPLGSVTTKAPSPAPSSSSNQQPSQNATTNPSTPSGPPPTVPYGDFVSNHHPGGSAPTSEASVCNTSAGATCYIQFTKGTDVKKLDARTTNSKGAAIWYWDVNTAGLTAGSWTVTAVATLNGQTKTADDALPLMVP